MAYLDTGGLTHLWTKIKAALSGKQDKIEASGLLEGDGAGGVNAAETVEAELVEMPEGLPAVLESDNGVMLRVISGQWTKQAFNVEDWTFTLEDGSTVTKSVLLSAVM